MANRNARQIFKLTRLIQSVESTPLGEVPVALHHARLDGIQLARGEGFRLVVPARLVAGVV